MEAHTSAFRIAVVGLGQAGGNLATEFHRRGYPALALNTAHSDLAALDTPAEGPPLPQNRRFYIGLDGNDGAGGDPAYGRNCLETHAATITAAVEEIAADADAIVLAAGLGGGTGSNLAVLAGLLDAWPRVALAALPARHEGATVQLCALQAVNDILGVDDLGCILADNGALIRTHASVSIQRFHETINGAIVDPLDSLLRLNDSDELAALRPLDGEDLRGLLLSGGMLHYAEANLKELSAEGLLQAYLDALADGPVMSAGFDAAKVARCAIAIEGGQTELGTTPFSFAEEVHGRVAEATGGAQLTLSLYRAAGESPSGVTVRMLSASTELPSALRDVAADIQAAARTLHDKLRSRPAPLDLGDVGALMVSGRRRALERDRAVARDATPIAEPAARPAPLDLPPAPEAAAEPVPEPTISLDESADQPERQSFERIAAAYRKASTPRLRDEIAQRLRTFGTSARPLVRYYAINAMAQLDAERFKDALTQATRDEDAHVRHRATEALERASKRAARARRRGSRSQPGSTPSA